MWINLGIFVLTTVLSALLSPRPKSQKVMPGTIGEDSIPYADPTAPIIMTFGTTHVKLAILWSGDFTTKAIRKKGGKK